MKIKDGTSLLELIPTITNLIAELQYRLLNPEQMLWSY